MSENGKTEELIRQIRETRAEQNFAASRLLTQERMLRCTSLYYAVLASGAAVLGLMYPLGGYMRLTALLTAALSMLTAALCVQKYVHQAHACRANAQALERLLLEAEDADEEGCRAVREKYAMLLALCAPRSAHERRAALRMHDIESMRRVLRGEEVIATHYLCGYEKFSYWFAEIAIVLVRVLIFLLPVLGLLLTFVGLI